MLTQGARDVTSPVKLVTVGCTSNRRAARVGSLTMLSFFRAHFALIPASGDLPTPRRTRDADKNKQGSKLHIHIGKLVYLDTVITIY